MGERLRYTLLEVLHIAFCELVFVAVIFAVFCDIYALVWAVIRRSRHPPG